MQKSNRQKVAWLCAVLGALCLPLLALEWNHGHFLMDDGFILAFAWRIWNGEVPYRDFIFHKTPLTLYLHSLWLFLPDNLPYIAARFGFYLQMFLIALLPNAWAIRRGYIGSHFSSLAIIGILFLFSFHNFPPMPWYTVDANLFATTGLILLLKSIEETTKERQTTFGFLSAFSFVLAFLCKQNYAVLIPFFFVTFGFFAWRRHRTFSTVIPALAVVAVTLLIPVWLLIRNGAWTNFIEQLLTLTTTSAFEQIALPWILEPFLSWKFFLSGVLMLVFALAGAAQKYGKVSPAISSGVAMIPFVILCYFARLFQNETQIGFWVFWSTAILVVTSTLQLRVKSSTSDVLWAIFSSGALLISFVSAISYGWITPLLAAAAYGPIYARPLERVLPGGRMQLAQRAIAGLFLIFIFSIFVMSRQTNLFTEQARSAQTYNLGEIYPRLEGVYSNRQIYEDYLQMNQITRVAAEQFGSPVIVMPNFPLFYFLEGKQNPMTVDWWDDGDTLPHREKLQAELWQKKPLILFQKCLSVYEEGCDPERGLVPQWVLNHSKVLIETGRFSLVSLQ